ncbi:MAG: N-acetyltransferase [Parvularculales bacterium]
MEPDLKLRECLPADMPSLNGLYSASFPEEELFPLICRLLDGKHHVLSLTGMVDEDVVSHIVFTMCALEDGPDKIALLGPVCVNPRQQGRGYGSRMIRAGLEQLKQDQVPTVCVLGDPGYYGRFGFAPERNLMPPYPLSEEWADAWQSLLLNDHAGGMKGVLVVPEPWQRAELWS